jgi:hypothetical protein
MKNEEFHNHISQDMELIPASDENAIRIDPYAVGDHLFRLIQDVHDKAAPAYDTLTNPWTMKAARRFLCSKEVRELEDTINAQCLVAKQMPLGSAACLEAVRRVEMYCQRWLSLVLHKMGMTDGE